MVLIETGVHFQVVEKDGFRPLAGIMVLINTNFHGSGKITSFRPLAGIMVLIIKSNSR